MNTKRWSSREALANAPSLTTWPDVNLDGLDLSEQETFLTRKKAILLYADGLPLAEIETQTGVSKNQLPTFLKRCLKLAEDGQVYGFRALIPYSRTVPYMRTAMDAKKLPQAKGGKAGMLGVVLRRFPDLEESLVAHILKKRKGRVLHEHRI